MVQPQPETIGKVYLVGAGPGDPGLITLRGVECLGRADVVLYDYLVNPQLLRYARPGARTICLGRHGHGRIWSQDEINQQLVEQASQGQTVVRLKSGDPAVFARGAEEAEVLAARDIPFEIVPGITVALAASSCAGIPVTHRDYSSAVALVTGQQGPESGSTDLDYAALARFPGTLVFYMGVTTAERWTRALIEAGKPPDTPCAIIRRCSFPDQLRIACRLDEVTERLAGTTKIRPPVIVMVGEVTRLAPTLSWFDKRPLFGQTILVARPEPQAASLADRLAELGAQVLVQPAIEITDPPSWAPVDDAQSRLSDYDWLVFSSANGVRYLLGRLLETGHDMRTLGNLRLAAIGPGTAAALSQYHLRADLVPAEFRAESLAESLANVAPGKRFLLARASRGREVLADQLQAAGGAVDQIVVYTSRDVTEPDGEIQQDLSQGKIDWIVITSSAIARSLTAMFGDAMRKSRLATISPVTSATVRELGFEPAAEATQYTMDGIIDAIVGKVAVRR